MSVDMLVTKGCKLPLHRVTSCGIFCLLEEEEKEMYEDVIERNHRRTYHMSYGYC